MRRRPNLSRESPAARSRRFWRYSLIIAFGLSALGAPFSPSGGNAAKGETPTSVAREISFADDVRPIFQDHCVNCHGPEKSKSNYRLDSRSSALEGGEIGGSIVPGDSAASPLVQYVSGQTPELLMPAEGPPLSPEEVGVLRAWIDQGANWPDEFAEPTPRGMDHWAFRALSSPAVPEFSSSERGANAWVRTPIDAFIWLELARRGMTPNPEADRTTLIRRLSFDLLGLPPTPEEVREFLADDSDQAYERLVDRLLASPRHGERWARHWMDVVHFAETHGNDQDRPRPNAWPYRDYLVRTFNEDRSYSRFVQEQIAGDVLFPDEPQAIVATGFLAAGPWDESSQQSIQDDTIDKKIARNLDRDDVVTTTMSTFTSLSVHCARCHEHKFDPISQSEYYALQAVFSGIDKANRAYDVDPQVAGKRRELVARLAEFTASAGDPPAWLADDSARQIAQEWEAAQGKADDSWTVVSPTNVAVASGAKTETRPDGAILVTGDRADKDTYTIAVDTDLSGITGVRLEALADESLPMRGPGRQENGNFHLTEFQVMAAPRAPLANAAGSISAAVSPADANPSALDSAPRPIKLIQAQADFDQEGWTVAMAIDGNPATAWGIHPKVGQTHVAMFRFESPVGFEGGTTLTFRLEQDHGRGHLIGMPRLSITRAKDPIAPRVLPPEDVLAVLAVPAADRTPAQQATLTKFAVTLKLKDELAALPPRQMVYAGTTEFEKEGSFAPARGPRPVFLLRRGDVGSPLEPVSPRGLALMTGLSPALDLPRPDDEGARRAALANWLTDRANALVWRSIVNRVWHYHFGRGIVETPNDFGRQGGTPTHPELLDWLARWFEREGGSWKRLHRMIVTSSAYRQSSAHRDDYEALDAGASRLWRMNRVRLDAESIRDAILQVTGKLDLAMEGPSVKQFIETPGIHVTPDVDYANFDVDSPASYRRGVYRFLFRTLPDPFMDSMDCADASRLTPTRNVSVTALQALAMSNNHFVTRQAEHFASRLEGLAPELPARVSLAFEWALSRQPTPEESELLVGYAEKHGLANACRLILNSNEFLFVQ